MADIFLTSVKEFLRPMVRFCLNHSIKLQEISEVLKILFLEEGEKQFKNKNEPVSMSRLSVMTGVHRKDVARLYKYKEEPKNERNLVVRILGQWQSNRKFSKGGNPNMLTIEGRDSEFVELVQSVSTDLNPYTVLYELERCQLVRRVGNKLKLLSRVYIPSDIKAGLELLASDVNDLVSAVESNLFDGNKIPNLHVSTYYDNIVEKALPKIQQWILIRGARFHRELRAFLSRYDRDLNPSLKGEKTGVRVMVGSFGRTESEAKAKKGKKNDQ